MITSLVQILDFWKNTFFKYIFSFYVAISSEKKKKLWVIAIGHNWLSDSDYSSPKCHTRESLRL